jgi:hypothetical protein
MKEKTKNVCEIMEGDKKKTKSWMKGKRKKIKKVY